MSQEKVDRYKEEKKGRKARIKKEKRKKMMWKIFGPVLVLLIIALIGAGAYFIPKWTTQYAEEQTADEIDYDQLMQLINQSAEESETSADTGSDTSVTRTSDSDSDAQTVPESEE